MRIAFLFLLSLLPLAAVENFLPLQTGNTWTYRDAKSGQTFTVRVSLPLINNGRVYYSLHGYAAQRLWVRVNQDGQLVYLDENGERELLLTPFAENTRDWSRVPFRPCEDTEARPEERSTGLMTPAGPFGSGREVLFRSATCRDAGIEREQFASNIGMVRRVEQTIAGPRQFDLVYARVGKQEIDAEPTARFTVSVSQRPGAQFADVTLRLDTGGEPINLPFASSQEFELVLKDESGAERWRYSDGRVFTPVVSERLVTGWTATVRVPVPDFQGRPSVPYTITASLNTIAGGPQYAATAAVRWWAEGWTFE